MIFWGSPAQPGSLCNMREIIRRIQVDKTAKVFNVADEFVLHIFKAHLQAQICQIFKISSSADDIQHLQTAEWLHETANTVVATALMPKEDTDDPVYNLHRNLLYQTYLYVDLREAVRWEDGPHIVRHWKLWLPQFIGTGRKNYAAECVNMLANLCADFPKHILYIVTNNRTVNVEGIPGRGKPIDQMMEHYNL